MLSTYNQNNVTVVVDCVNLFQWNSVAQIANDSSGYDLIMLDNEFLGEAVSTGNLAELTEFLTDPAMQLGDFYPAVGFCCTGCIFRVSSKLWQIHGCAFSSGCPHDFVSQRRVVEVQSALKLGM